MIELRKKRNFFHQSLKMQKRQAFKAQIRKKFISSHKRQLLLQELDKAFWFRNVTQTEKQEFWAKEFIPNRKNYSSIFELIESVSQKVKMVICQHEKDDDAHAEIRQYLFDNIPFLIPPPHFDLSQLPIVLVQLCVHILRQIALTSEEKEHFVERMNYETINKCLLNYFVQNWDEISQNKCNDIMMTFFTEMTQFKNIFKRYVYNDIKFEFLLNLIIKDIFKLTEVQRSIYEIFELENQKFIEDFIFNTSSYGLQQNYGLGQEYEKNQKVENLVLNKSVFLCNLLLLSPIPNYNIKQTKQKLKTILNYLYRKLFLKQSSQVSQLQIQFCISVLLSKTIDINPYNNIQIIEAVMKSETTRKISQKSLYFQEFQPNQQTNIDNKQNNKRLVSYQESLNINGQNFQNLLNKTKLFMLYQASQELQQLKFDHIEKWITQQIRNEKNNILSLENPDLMSRFLSLLANVLHNHSTHQYNSYDSFRNRLSNQSQDSLITKIKICKLIGKKGFDQLFQHQNLKFYSSELLQLLVALVQGLKECGQISSSIEVLFFNSDILSQDSMRRNFQYKGPWCQEQMENQSIFFMNSFKYHIYGLCLKFLQRCYKFLGYEKKEKILLNLIFVDYLTFEDCRKYLTHEEEYKLRKNSFNQEDYFDQDESIEEENCQSQEEYQNNQKNQQFEQQKMWNSNGLKHQNEFYSNNQPLKFPFENNSHSNTHQQTIFSFTSDHIFKPKSMYGEFEIEI